MNTAVTVLATFLLGFSVTFFGSELLGRTLQTLGDLYVQFAR